MAKKKAGCEHQFASEPACQPAFRNIYECDNCGECWEDEHSATCDDECPGCSLAVSPTKSEQVAACACAYLG